MDTVLLKNGSEEADGMVHATMVVLRGLIRNDPLAMFELVEVCKDPEYVLTPHAKTALTVAAMIGDGGVRGSIRNIVLSAVSGEGFDAVLGSPIKD